MSPFETILVVALIFELIALCAVGVAIYVTRERRRRVRFFGEQPPLLEIADQVGALAASNVKIREALERLERLPQGAAQPTADMLAPWNTQAPASLTARHEEAPKAQRGPGRPRKTAQAPAAPAAPAAAADPAAPADCQKQQQLGDPFPE